jgi:acyl-CoA thioester hydrolase
MTGMTEHAAPVHELPVRVYYEDTDAAGIVYHASYLRFAERARTEFLRSQDLDHGQLAERHGIVFAVSRCTIDFLAPARLDDLVHVRSRVTRLGGVRVEFEQVVVGRAGSVLARLAVTLAVLDRQGLRPRRLPSRLRDAFAAAIPGSRTDRQPLS